jgi:SAM-dependent methyltransferase
VGLKRHAPVTARDVIDPREGRRLFGTDPAAYDRARPGHAERVYEVLVGRCGLAPGTAVLEIGPGTGQATRRLLELGADPLVALEPDPALAEHLRGSLGKQVDLRVTALEDAALSAGAFDLAAAASSFHWVDEAVGLAKLFRALRPGGWIALWWTLFGEADEPDAFIDATSPLLEGLVPSPSSGTAGTPHALETEARLGSLRSVGFEDLSHQVTRWTASWDAEGVRALYGTFSPIARLDVTRKTGILDAVARIAERDFGGRVTRRLTTSLYTARKPS